MNHNMQMQKETGKILHRKFLSENMRPFQVLCKR